MTVELFLLLVFLIILIVAVTRKLIFLAIIVVALAFAYYTGLAGAFFELVYPILAPLLGEVAEWLKIIVLPIYLR